MTYEDQFYSANENDVELHFNKHALTEVKNSDKYYEKYVLPVEKVLVNGEIYKSKRTIEKYGSGQVGSRIRNAVTGSRTGYLVGSVDEDLFFKVSDTYGRNGRREPLMLFYDSPEQYENHTFNVLDERVKESWHKKMLEVRKRYD
jgi:hypothetical protein